MNKKKRSIVILIIITLLIYNIIPIINDIFPNSVYYTFLTDLWIINSLYALISSIVMSKKYGFNICIILLISILFVPTMLIFYNTSALIFMIAYLVLALIGSLIGRFIYKKKQINSNLLLGLGEM